jgi:hypothetical protein
MPTQLGSYCKQFDETLRPALCELDLAIEALNRAPEDAVAKPLHRPLLELQHQVRALCDKVSEQQAYVLIFGPLKSGKSTLMNAVAASYVSEVSSLPAYPCLVFVRSGAKREFLVTCYDGTVQRFAEAARLHEHIAAAHVELAAAIRAAEDKGLTFDPQEHFQAAIRRVDVHVPDSELKKTGAVLVDTPGLYTRMRFGYDRMTRDFRDAAACAVFVVKSDTLFLEQVFAEFQQLLDLFSRIFLVVNIDSHKRDVGPDGRLVPSLEQSKPEEVLRAFERLAMSAPLKQAAEEGKVRMYPVDLLHAASDRLSRGATRAPSRSDSGFDRLDQDLSSYLASKDYMSAFLRDSLQRADMLLDELRAQLQTEPPRLLERSLAKLAEERDWLENERDRVTSALQQDWAAAFARGDRDVEAEVERAARDRGAKLLRTLGASIDTWFLSGHSLQWLVQDHWTPLVRDYREAVREAGARAFDQVTGQRHGGLELAAGVADLLQRADVDVVKLRADALADAGAVPWPQQTSVPVDVRTIPVKKGLLDRLSFRSLDRVRERLFGPPDQPDVKMLGKDKAKHLGEPGRLHLHQCVAQFRGELLPQTTSCLRQHFGDRFVAAAARRLEDGLRAYAPKLEARLREVEAEHQELAQIALPLRNIDERSEGIRRDLAALEQRFVQDPDLAPDPADVVLQPAQQPAREGAAARRGAAPTARR